MAAVDRTRGLGGLPEAECLVVFGEGGQWIGAGEGMEGEIPPRDGWETRRLVGRRVSVLRAR